MKQAAGCSVGAVALGVVLVFVPSARGADTVNTWDEGATNVEFYLGADGIGLGKYPKTIYSDIMLGYGLIKRFSAYWGTMLEANEYFAAGSASLYTGLFGTPLDTDHFDLDLFFDVSGGGLGFSEFKLNPALELNFDLDPDMRNWGMYLRAGVPICGRDLIPDEDAEPAHGAAAYIECTIGTYCTIADRHQVLIEYDMAFRPTPGEEEHDIEIGCIALGYNVLLHEAIEMINQVLFDIPQNDEYFSVGLMVGFAVPSIVGPFLATPATKED